MINSSSKIFIVIFLMLFLVNSVYALEFDTSVDAQIRAKYNSNKLNEDVLPPLPSVKNTPAKTTSTTNLPKQNLNFEAINVPNITVVDEKEGIKISRFTKFQVKSNVKINPWLAKGSNVSFTTTSPVYKKYLTIPSGTTINGIIKDIHLGQKTGNGALVKIDITSIKYNGQNVKIDGKITKANGKRIFFNNIKGNRAYLKGVSAQYQKGENFYKKCRSVSSKMSTNPIGAVLSIIPTATGAVGYTVLAAASPITGLTKKGENFTIPANSNFEIKLKKYAVFPKK